MGATLRYAKVVDRDHVQAHGGLSPSTDNLVTLRGEAPAVARDFLVSTDDGQPPSSRLRRVSRERFDPRSRQVTR